MDTIDPAIADAMAKSLLKGDWGSYSAEIGAGHIATLKDFTFLKSMRLVPVKEPFSDETQAKIKALLPKTALQFK